MKAGMFRKMGLVLAFAAALAGCGQSLGPGAETPGLQGTTTLTQVFNGGPQQPSTTIRAEALKANESYNAKGELVIEGSVPAGVRINVQDGKLTVTGDIGNGARIDVSQPTTTHSESYTGYCYSYSFSGKYEYGFSAFCSRTVVDGLTYNDAAPAVAVRGTIGTDVRIATPGSITVNGREIVNPSRIMPVAPKPGA